MGARWWPGVLNLLLTCASTSAESEQFLPHTRALVRHGLEGGRELSAAPSVCRAVAMRLMPTPAVKSFDQCFQGKVNSNSSHDWSIPGAAVAAQVDCWCQHNLTATIRDYGCCEHRDIYPMCDTDCHPDCSSQLARECIQDCPSMCFEAADYILEDGLCAGCNWARCWPVVGCLTDHADERVENGTLARTCHETEFSNSQELENYMECWKVVPKHTSHWNILSSLVHCICREGMDRKARETHCCDSLLYGAGVCNLQCLEEEECASQEAQTCVHDCQRRCPATDVVPSSDCTETCLKDTAPCRRYVSCRPPSVHTHVCDDGQWPDASSGCCKDNATQTVGCPRLCETQRLWRLDRSQARPWWTRWPSKEGITVQCTCMDCPERSETGYAMLRQTVTESIWDNGQVMLVDIARREGLRLGPNRHMQELMLERNSEILRAMEESGNSTATDRRIGAINERFAVLIEDAARLGEDPQPSWHRGTRGGGGIDRDSRNLGVIAAIILTCVLVILSAIIIATFFVLRKKARESEIRAFEENQQVVIGSPIPATSDVTGVTAGAPVTVAAPTKTSKGKRELALDVS